MAKYSSAETPQGQKAAQLKEDLRYQLDNIRKNSRLTPAGKRAHIATTYLATRSTSNSSRPKKKPTGLARSTS
ncbi:hypothetical protein ACTHQ6_09370 [Arthrobacter sp. SAFR-179]|uniref:hypothetical protein n=1 Tax=Arthrobacter sp. SAFR-179 TaxID=3387279 RepID=UPI003F7C1ACA